MMLRTMMSVGMLPFVDSATAHRVSKQHRPTTQWSKVNAEFQPFLLSKVLIHHHNPWGAYVPGLVRPPPRASALERRNVG